VTRPAPAPRLPDRLRTLARRVERLSPLARRDPEQLLPERQSVVQELLDLARETERAR
jgi:hypothetical protein